MTLKLKTCIDCGIKKKIGGSKKRCKSCRKKANELPEGFVPMFTFEERMEHQELSKKLITKN